MTSSAVLIPNIYAQQDDIYCNKPDIQLHTSTFGKFSRFGRHSKQLAFSGKAVPGSTVYADFTGHNSDLLGSSWISIKRRGIRHRTNPMVRSHHSSNPMYHHYQQQQQCYGNNPYDSIASSDSVMDDYADYGMQGGMMQQQQQQMQQQPEGWAMYVDGVSHAAIRDFGIEMNSISVITLSGQAFDMFDDVYNTGAQEADEVSRFGHSDDDKYKRWKASKKNKTDIVNTRLPFNLPSHRFPSAAVSFTKVRARLSIEDQNRLVDTSDGSVPYVIDEDRELKPEDWTINLYIDLYWVTEAERALIVQTEHSFVIDQVAHLYDDITPKNTVDSGSIHRFNLSLQHPAKEIIFAYQPNSQIREKNWFAYTNPDGSYPIQKADLHINGTPLHGMRDFVYHQQCELGRFHNKKTRKGFGGFVFSEYPENFVQPTGYLNPSAVRDITLQFELAPGTEAGRIHVWVPTLNVVTFGGKMCKIAYLNNN